MKKKLLLATLLLVSLFTALQLASANRFGVFCEDDEYDHHVNQARPIMEAFYETFRDYWWDRTLISVAGTGDWFVDADKSAGGNDHLLFEKIDVVYYVGHGASDNSFGIWEHQFILSDHSNVYPLREMYLGDVSGNNIEFLLLTVCHSMDQDDDVWRNTWRDYASTGNGTVFGGIHQILGHHGLAWGSAAMADEVENFVNNAYSTESVGLAWKTDMHNDSTFPGDNCPVAYAGRNSLAAAEVMLDNETFSNRDSYADIANPPYFKRRFVDGCAPAGADPM
jgi:Family of unknown function (DUF6345)